MPIGGFELGGVTATLLPESLLASLACEVVLDEFVAAAAVAIEVVGCVGPWA